MVKNKDTMLMFVFICLLKQADTWSSVLVGNINHETKQRFNLWQGTNKMLLKELAKHIDMEWVEENSEVFSDILHFLVSEQNAEKKFQFIGAIQAFMKGEVIIQETDSESLTQ